MRKLSVGQRKNLAEFFTNAAVAWLSAGVIAPLLTEKTLISFIGSSVWGISFTVWFMLISLEISKKVNS